MKEKHLATQANALIRANQGELTLTEKRIMLYLISKIKPEDEGFKYYRVNTSEFASMLPHDGNNETMQCMNACDRMQDKKISVDFGDHITQTRLILKSKYFVGQGFFEVVLDDELKPLLLQLREHFTSIYIKNALQLTSVNAVRLYEILKSWESTGKLVTTPDKLKEMMGLDGKYEKFSQLKANCLKPIFKQIKDKTELEVTSMKEKRQGRRVVEVTIIFKKKKLKTLPSSKVEEVIEPENPTFINEIMKRGVVYHQEKFEKEGLTQEHWEKALFVEGLNGAHLVTEARKIRDQSKLQQEEKEKKAKVDEIIKKNKDFWDKNDHKYTVSGTSTYIHPTEAKPILFKDPDFLSKIDKYRKSQDEIDAVEERRKLHRRKNKTLIGGSSDTRKIKDRRQEGKEEDN